MKLLALLRFAVGVLVYILFVYLLYINIYSVALMVFSLSFVLLTGILHSLLCNKIKTVNLSPVNNKKIPLQPFLIIWIIPTIFAITVGISFYAKSGFFIGLFVSLFLITSASSYLLHNLNLLKLLELNK